jgi:hypothetical protein
VAYAIALGRTTAAAVKPASTSGLNAARSYPRSHPRTIAELCLDGVLAIVPSF